jgi:hypothetical protein
MYETLPFVLFLVLGGVPANVAFVKGFYTGHTNATVAYDYILLARRGSSPFELSASLVHIGTKRSLGWVCGCMDRKDKRDSSTKNP